MLLIIYPQVLTEDDKKHLILNMSSHMKDAQEFIQKRAVANFSKCDPEYGRRLQEALDQFKKSSQVGAVISPSASYTWVN